MVTVIVTILAEQQQRGIWRRVCALNRRAAPRSRRSVVTGLCDGLGTGEYCSSPRDVQVRTGRERHSESTTDTGPAARADPAVVRVAHVMHVVHDPVVHHNSRTKALNEGSFGLAICVKLVTTDSGYSYQYAAAELGPIYA
jgi:hypothetical protein